MRFSRRETRCRNGLVVSLSSHPETRLLSEHFTKSFRIPRYVGSTLRTESPSSSETRGRWGREKVKTGGKIWISVGKIEATLLAGYVGRGVPRHFLFVSLGGAYWGRYNIKVQYGRISAQISRRDMLTGSGDMISRKILKIQVLWDVIWCNLGA